MTVDSASPGLEGEDFHPFFFSPNPIFQGVRTRRLTFLSCLRENSVA